MVAILNFDLYESDICLVSGMDLLYLWHLWFHFCNLWHDAM